MEKLKNFKLNDLYQLLQLTDTEFENWLKDAQLIFKTRKCSCGKEMGYKWKKDSQMPLWICNFVKNHDGKRPTVGYFMGTFFEHSHLSPKQVFEFTYYWCRDLFTQEELNFQMGLGSHAIVDWKNFCRDVTVDWISKNPQKIGAGGAIVEIDETVLSRPKYNRGKMEAVDQWFFGGVERGSGKCFIVPVEKRDAATLLPIIQKHIFPGAVIISDCWAAYNRIDQLQEFYAHYTVNHSECFVDPDSGAHTNTIESTWQKFKKGHKERFGTHRSLFSTYLSDFLWRKQFSGPDVFYHFWSQIAKMYVVSS